MSDQIHLLGCSREDIDQCPAERIETRAIPDQLPGCLFGGDPLTVDGDNIFAGPVCVAPASQPVDRIFRKDGCKPLVDRLGYRPAVLVRQLAVDRVNGVRRMPPDSWPACSGALHPRLVFCHSAGFKALTMSAQVLLRLQWNMTL